MPAAISDTIFRGGIDSNRFAVGCSQHHTSAKGGNMKFRSVLFSIAVSIGSARADRQRACFCAGSRRQTTRRKRRANQRRGMTAIRSGSRKSSSRPPIGPARPTPRRRKRGRSPRCISRRKTRTPAPPCCSCTTPTGHGHRGLADLLHQRLAHHQHQCRRPAAGPGPHLRRHGQHRFCFVGQLLFS